MQKKIPPSTKTGSHHWIMERVTALALVPLMIWLMISLIRIAEDPVSYLPVFFDYPINATMGILLNTIALYHGSMGMRVIIEDYVECKYKKHTAIFVIYFISFVSVVATAISILRLHLTA